MYTVAQNLLMHAALYRITPLLQQISAGLKSNGLLRAIESFPDVYAPLFVYMGEVSVKDVLKAIYIDFELTTVGPQDEHTLSLLKCFIAEADSEGNVLNGYWYVIFRNVRPLSPRT